MLRTANSVDGINWTDDTTMFQNPADPLLVPGVAHINRGSYGPLDVLYFADNPDIVDIDHPFNNRYVMYYSVKAGNIQYRGGFFGSIGRWHYLE